MVSMEKGIAVAPTRVFIEPGKYPRMWKKRGENEGRKS